MTNDPIVLVILLSLLSLLPVIFIMTTSFVKVAMVLILTRESLGVQQVPPNIVLYGISLILSFYVMGPIYKTGITSIVNDVSITQNTQNNLSTLKNDFTPVATQLKTFLTKHTSQPDRAFFYQSLQQFWDKDMMKDVSQTDLIILVPSFMVSEITQAFKIGFLIYLPSVIIDIIVSNILMSIGMMMMSPVTISLPIKLLLFVALDGWHRLIHVLLGSYI